MTPIQKRIIFIQLQIFDFIIKFWAHIIEKICAPVYIYYRLQNNGAMLLQHLFHGDAFSNLNFNKVKSYINV